MTINPARLVDVDRLLNLGLSLFAPTRTCDATGTLFVAPGGPGSSIPLFLMLTRHIRKLRSGRKIDRATVADFSEFGGRQSDPARTPAVGKRREAGSSILTNTNIIIIKQNSARREKSRGNVYGGNDVADIVIMGAGLSGAIMAYEMKEQMRPEDRLTVVTKDPIYHFVPSNPWVPVGWRKREALEVDLAPTFAKRGIAFKAEPGDQSFAEGQHDRNRRRSRRSNTTTSSSPPAPSSLSMRSRGSDRRASPNRSATSTTPRRPRPSSRRSARIPARSSSARRRAPRASARPTSSCSSSRPSCAAARSATGCRSPSSRRSPISATSASTASATPRGCSRASCANTTSNGSPARGSRRSKTAR